MVWNALRIRLFWKNLRTTNSLLISTIEYPYIYRSDILLPEKHIFIKALDYETLEYNTPRPWDKQVIDGMKKGEIFEELFTQHKGLGDRDNNRYILPKYSKLETKIWDAAGATWSTILKSANISQTDASLFASAPEMP